MNMGWWGVFWDWNRPSLTTSLHLQALRNQSNLVGGTSHSAIHPVSAAVLGGPATSAAPVQEEVTGEPEPSSSSQSLISIEELSNPSKTANSGVGSRIISDV